MNLAGSTVYSGSSFTDALQWACSKVNAIVKIPGGTYNLTGRITLAAGVYLYGHIVTSPWVTADFEGATILNFPGTSANEGFLVQSNCRISLLQINKGNVEISTNGGNINSVILRGIQFNQCTSSHPSAIDVTAASGFSVSGLDFGACSNLNSTVPRFKSTGAVSAPALTLCSL